MLSPRPMRLRYLVAASAAILIFVIVGTYNFYKLTAEQQRRVSALESALRGVAEYTLDGHNVFWAPKVFALARSGDSTIVVVLNYNVTNATMVDTIKTGDYIFYIRSKEWDQFVLEGHTVPVRKRLPIFITALVSNRKGIEFSRTIRRSDGEIIDY